jgi:CubicO group peptidase (beta-lactamase class C family)
MTVARYVILIALVTAAGLPSVRAEPSGVAERIARVEGGLLPAIVFKGEAGRPVSILPRMRHHKVPGLSIAVIEDGRVQWARGYGVTEADEKVAVTPATLFQAGAVSKPVAAMAALLLVQDGRVDLDADVNSRLVAWKVPENRFTETQNVTLRRLLSHTAGVNVDGFPGYAAGRPVPSLAEVLRGTEPARNPAIGVDLVPGSAFRQSGGGYVIVQQLLTDVTGEAFPRLMEQAVLSKLGMSGSTYEQPLPAERAAGAASGHQADGAAVQGGWRVYPELAAAGLWTTPSDLARFAIEVRAAADGRDHRLLSPATAALMLTPQANNAGLGLFVDGTGEAEHFSHAGRNAGFDTVMVMYRRTGSGAVLMMNANNNAGLANEVFDSIAKEYGWPGHRATPQREMVKVDRAVLRRYEGRYRVGAAGPVIAVRCEDDRLFATFPGLGTIELFAESETAFFITAADLRFSFAPSGTDGAAALVVKAKGQSQTATRVRPGG